MALYILIIFISTHTIFDDGRHFRRGQKLSKGFTILIVTEQAYKNVIPYIEEWHPTTIYEIHVHVFERTIWANAAWACTSENLFLGSSICNRTACGLLRIIHSTWSSGKVSWGHMVSADGNVQKNDMCTLCLVTALLTSPRTYFKMSTDI